MAPSLPRAPQVRQPSREVSLIWRASGESHCGHLWWLSNMVAVWLWLSAGNPAHLLLHKPGRPSSCRAQPQLNPVFDLSVLPLQGHSAFQKKQPFPSVFPSQRPAELWLRLEQSVPSKPRLGEELQVTSVTSDSVGLS